MANLYYSWYESITAPLVSFYYYLRSAFDTFCSFVFAIWKDHRPLHTIGYTAADPKLYMQQKARNYSFQNRLYERMAV